MTSDLVNPVVTPRSLDASGKMPVPRPLERLIRKRKAGGLMHSGKMGHFQIFAEPPFLYINKTVVLWVLGSLMRMDSQSMKKCFLLAYGLYCEF